MSIEAVATRSPLNTLGKVGKYVVLSIAVFLTLGPVVWTLFTALTPDRPRHEHDPVRLLGLR